MEPEQTQPTPASTHWFAALSSPRKILLAIIALIVLAFVLALLKSILGTSFGGLPMNVAQDVYYYPEMAFEERSAGSIAVNTKTVAYDYDDSMIAPAPSVGGGTGLYDEAQFESRSFRASFNTADMDALCDTFESWKSRTSLVMLYENRGDTYCSYNFKVARDDASRVVAELEALQPDDMTVHTETLKKQVVDHENAMQVLLRRETMLNEMLAEASAQYTSLAQLATDAGDVETLTTVINSQLTQINQLTREIQSVSAQIDAMARSKSELQDRIDFVYFNVSVSKYQVIDGTALKDSWVYKTQRFVHEVNTTAQSMTLGFVATLVWLVSVLLYVLVVGGVLFVVGKHVWRVARSYWQR